jgi:hypothetical protein
MLQSATTKLPFHTQSSSIKVKWSSVLPSQNLLQNEGSQCKAAIYKLSKGGKNQVLLPLNAAIYKVSLPPNVMICRVELKAVLYIYIASALWNAVVILCHINLWSWMSSFACPKRHLKNVIYWNSRSPFFFENSSVRDAWTAVCANHKQQPPEYWVYDSQDITMWDGMR